MRRECRERFPRHRIQREPLVSDPDMHHGTCVTHVPWCMPGSLNRSRGENVVGISGACGTRNFMYLVRGPRWQKCRTFSTAYFSVIITLGVSYSMWKAPSFIWCNWWCNFYCFYESTAKLCWHLSNINVIFDRKIIWNLMQVFLRD